jgi:hypothetical protein
LNKSKRFIARWRADKLVFGLYLRDLSGRPKVLCALRWPSALSHQHPNNPRNADLQALLPCCAISTEEIRHCTISAEFALCRKIFNHSGFLSYLDAFPDMAVRAREISVLLMNDYSDHVSDDVIHILTEARMRVITFAQHTTQVLEVLDLTLFGVPKRCPRHEMPFDDDNVTVDVIMKVYHDFTQTMARSNVWRVFRAL